jgi:2-polyprenyl-3-methyl-5-hydroxy-6-metoxy-1,4-benzoquinol methylase
MGLRPAMLLKNALLACLSRVTGRHAVLLPSQARDEDTMLALRAPYRVEGPVCRVELLEPGPGRLAATLLGYAGHFPVRTIWTGVERPYGGPSAIELDLTTGVVRLGQDEWGRAPLPLPGRRFCWQVNLTDAQGRRRSRLTGHYRVVEVGPTGEGSAIGESYYSGQNYVDHEAESAGDHGDMVEILKRHAAVGPVLEVGCATGGLLAALDAAGLPSIGVDASAWAVARAAERLGAGHAWLCDVERDPLPGEVKARGPFGALVLAAVFEHFHDPFAVLATLTGCARPGTVLLIMTANAQSLSHALFGSDWEGYFDWTHHGVDQVTVKSLREELPRLGWKVSELTTRLIWDADADPTRATLRQWWAADARFRRLLVERELGDFITCVAVRE